MRGTDGPSREEGSLTFSFLYDSAFFPGDRIYLFLFPLFNERSFEAAGLSFLPSNRHESYPSYEMGESFRSLVFFLWGSIAEFFPPSQVVEHISLYVFFSSPTPAITPASPAH